MNISKSNNNETSEMLKIDIEFDTSEDITPSLSFDDIGLENDDLLRGIYAYGFEKPSPIQQYAIKPMISGRDLIAQAHSGTGKTATFVIGLLNKINPKIIKPQALVISPTRELAIQSNNVLKNLGSYMDIKSTICIGGGKRNRYVSNSINSQIIVGTPGRISDMIGRRLIETDDISIIVLDEADDVLSASFRDQVKAIFNNIPKTCQVCLFSATMPQDIFELTDRIMNDPIKILVKKEDLTLDGIKQYYIFVDKDEFKFCTLCDLYSEISVAQAIIYCNQKDRVDSVVDALRENNFPVSHIHGNLLQSERQEVMQDFRSGNSRILVTTDILSRGIDVQQVSLVINYDLPRESETYIHRIGRSGRFGRKGIAINFVTRRDSSIMKHIERHYNTEIEALPKNIGDLMSHI